MLNLHTVFVQIAVISILKKLKNEDTQIIISVDCQNAIAFWLVRWSRIFTASGVAFPTPRLTGENCTDNNEKCIS